MKKIYFDNASTTICKPKQVIDGVHEFLTTNGMSLNRSSNSFEIDNLIWKTREKIATFFDFNKPENVIFTKNITDSLNIVIRGIFNSSDHVIISNLEHNAVIRTIIGNKIDFSVANFDSSSEIFMQNIENQLRSSTKAIIMTHASNVTGDILPIDEISEFCKKNNLIFILDTAQTAGNYKISSKKVDIIAFTGHKTLYGMQGIGGFIVNDSEMITATNFGGTGSNSSDFFMPSSMPERLEVGTHNIPGIVSLFHSFDTLYHDLHHKELQISDYFNKNISSFSNVELKCFSDEKVAISSLNFKNCDNSEACDYLNSHNIVTRSGLHCAPLAHKSIGTFKTGTVRFSFDYNNSKSEIDFALNVIENLTKF